MMGGVCGCGVFMCVYVYMLHVSVCVSVHGVCTCGSVFVGVWWRRVFAVAALFPCEEDSFVVQFAAQGISIQQHDEEEEEEEEEVERDWGEHEDEFEHGEEDEEEKGDVDLL